MDYTIGLVPIHCLFICWTYWSTFAFIRRVKQKKAIDHATKWLYTQVVLGPLAFGGQYFYGLGFNYYRVPIEDNLALAPAHYLLMNYVLS